MRLRQFDLIRYGKFTDRTIDFGPRVEGKPDFHIIHGPNEAGKSTLFSAWLDFLYGIDTRTPYNFLHDYKAMRISAQIEAETGAKKLTRIKKPQASLLDENDQPVGDHLLLGALGGLDRDAYKTMFSLDETTLEQGGEAILASKGDLGQLLFSASAGLSDLGQRLEAIRAETEEFHRPRASKTELADLKRRLEELKAERDAIDMAASEHARLALDRDKAKAAYDAANRARTDIRLTLDRARALQAALPQAARLAELRASIATTLAPPAPPAGWAADLPALRRREVELTTALARIARDEAKLAADLDARPPTDPILVVEAQFEDLADLAARAQSERQDLPRREAELKDADRTVDQILLRLGRPGERDPARLLLPAAVLGGLKTLIRQHQSLNDRHQAAEREARAAADAFAAAREDLAGEGAVDLEEGAVSRLADHLAALRGADHAARLERAADAVAAAKAALERRLSALRPWRGDLDTLSQFAPPAKPVLSDWRTRRQVAATALDQARTEDRRLKAEIAGLQAERTAMADLSGVISDAALKQARDAREAAWTEHRAALTGDSADRFRARLDADDALRARAEAQAADAARLRTLDQSLARFTAQAAVAEKQLQDAETAVSDLAKSFAALVAATSPDLPQDFDLAGFEVWCEAVEQAQAALAALVEAERTERAAKDAAQSARTRLTAAMTAAGLAVSEPDLEALTLSARRFVDAETRREGLRKAAAARERDHDRRVFELQEARTALAAWSDAWTKAVAATWLSEEGRTPEAAVALEMLEAAQDLDAALTQRASLEDRVRKMERDIASFADSMRALAEDFGLDDSLPPRDIHRAITERLRRAREADLRAAETADRMTALSEEKAGVEEEQARLGAQILRMTGHFDVATLDEVEEQLALIARRAEREAEIARLSQDLRDSLGATTQEQAEALLEGIDRDQLAREIEEIRPAAEALEIDCQRLYAEASQAEARLSAIDGDDRVARLIERRRTVLIEIEAGARRHLELRLGALAADQALRLYRDRHRSSMMARASDAFAQMSRGNYTGLSTQRDGQQETLIALTADGGSKQAEDMSKGTQFQLYLALRVAGYQEYAAARPPAPFIADDIMESFDEFRASEALTQLARMSGSGQVIYLTHHQHIRDIAREVCPDVRVHEL